MRSEAYWRDIAQCSREIMNVINKVPIEQKENLETMLHVNCVIYIITLLLYARQMPERELTESKPNSQMNYINNLKASNNNGIVGQK